MRFMNLTLGTCLAVMALAVGAADAAITYVDADPNSNTTEADGSALVTNGDNNGIDDIWRTRAFANPIAAPLILEANGATAGDADTEDTPRLRTTISGLNPGSSYSVYVYQHVSAFYRIAASLTNDPNSHLPVFLQADSTQVTDPMLANFTNVITNDSAYGTDSLYQVSLGTAVASGGGTIDVYVDNDTRQATQDARLDPGSVGAGNQWDFRTVYDGVGFELIPEPASLMLLLGGVALTTIVRRRD